MKISLYQAYTFIPSPVFTKAGVFLFNLLFVMLVVTCKNSKKVYNNNINFKGVKV